MNFVDMDLLSKLDVNRFTVEETAKLMHCFRWTAKLILKTAVWRGEFTQNEDGTYRLISQK